METTRYYLKTKDKKNLYNTKYKNSRFFLSQSRKCKFKMSKKLKFDNWLKFIAYIKGKMMSVKQIIADVNNYIEENLDAEFEGLATDLAEVTDFPELVKELVELANEGMKEYTEVAMKNIELEKNIKILEKLYEEHQIESLLDKGIAYQKQVLALEERCESTSQENEELKKGVEERDKLLKKMLGDNGYMERLLDQRDEVMEVLGEITKAVEEEEYQPKGSRIDPEGLHDFMNDTIQELKYENKKYKKMFDNLPNVKEGLMWCVKHQRWRWDDDGFVSESEDESEGEITESEEEITEEEDEKKEFLERHNISEDDLKELMKQCEGRI